MGTFIPKSPVTFTEYYVFEVELWQNSQRFVKDFKNTGELEACSKQTSSFLNRRYVGR